MDPNLLEKMLTAQDEFLAVLDKKAEELRKSQTPSEDALKEKDELLDNERKRLENLNGSKEQAVARFEAEITRQNERIKSLEKEIAEDRRSLKSAGEKPAAGKKGASTLRKAKKGAKTKKVR
jgi:predicted  nucleic acid-binding Zn-ribbon protein